MPTPTELRAARKRLGMTQAQLAEGAGVSQPLVARIETGKVEPSYATLRALVDALNQAERQETRTAEIMRRPVASVGPDATVREAVAIMKRRQFSQLPVLDDDVPVGSLSESDILHAFASGEREHLAERPVREVMGPPFPAVGPDDGVDQALLLLGGRAAVLVMERGRTIGIVTKSDLVRRVG